MEATDAQIRAAKARYMREWRKRNPDKQRETQLRYWRRRVERELAEEGGETDEQAKESA